VVWQDSAPKGQVFFCGMVLDFGLVGMVTAFTGVDRNLYKHGRYTPGMHIPIHPVAAIDEARPDYILILPWNLTHEIVAQNATCDGLGMQIHCAHPGGTHDRCA
jgi:hypothetical protein